MDWNWSAECEEPFIKVKKNIIEAPLIIYFNPDKELVLQVDSSKDGLGAALLPDGKPIEYASRAPTSAEQNWAQIEKETAVVFGLEHFDQYTCGRKVVIENDHKPLAAILKKPLSQAPKRPQALILWLHRYDVDFHYVEGSKLFITDTPSRAFLDVPDTHVRVIKGNAWKGESDERINEATADDESMHKLLSIIRDSWRDNKNEVLSELKPFLTWETL